MKLTFLHAAIPLTKTYIKRADGSIDKSSYPNVTNFTSIEEDCPDLKSMEVAMRKHAALGNSLLKGNVGRPLNDESRKGSTDSTEPTDWIVFDIDGLPNAATVDQFLTNLGMNDVSHIIQYSASHLVNSTDLRAHVIIQLTKAMAAPLLKQWLMDLNHKTDMLRSAMQLTKTANSITWPLDVTACQNDKLIYIAPPILKGIKDPMANKKRITFVQRKHAKYDITSPIPTTEANRAKTHARINELRKAAGLEDRKHTYKVIQGNHCLVKPDNATISEIKVDRGFVYFNLNGGDSWAYYHPENNPDFIFNFKGEPTYQTKELLPEYWEELSKQGSKVNSSGIAYIAVLDKITSTYYRGTYDQAKDILDLHVAKNETQVRHFAKQYGLPLGDFIPEWELYFDPLNTTNRIDEANKRINIFERTEYAKQKPRKTTSVPPTIAKIIMHAIGNDVDVYEHFLNWLACIFQYKMRTQTAWVLTGVEGTGKGMIMNKIIRPLLGTKHTAVKHMDELNERYSHYLLNNFVLFIDEIETEALDNEKGAAAKLRNWITEPTVTIRAMHTGSQDGVNYNNLIVASNKPNSVKLNQNDRRYNVAIFQPHRLMLTDKEIDRIDTELQAFHDYIMTRPASKRVAGSLVNTQDRQALISLSQTSIDVAVNALIAGDLEFFIDQLPSDESFKTNALKMNKVTDYKETLLHIIARTDKSDGSCSISRDELQVIFGYAVGTVPETPNKFTSMMKHHRVNITKVWIAEANKAVQGIKVTWADFARMDELKEMIEPTPAPKQAVAKKPVPKGGMKSTNKQVH